ncbi:MAG: hypothetical protein DME33_06570 [Verrucomicrobia bacterium]|nr:MAG: hypothetical protein DME33_06570 [Verrucomicrobiota bacterium]
MKFTVAVAELERLFKATVERPRKTDTVTLSACAGHVFIECRGDVAGIESPVIRDGAVTLSAQKFRDLLRTYKDMGALTFDGGAEGLHIETLPMRVLGYDPHPKPLAEL